jgi:hypothetical protein
MLILHAGFLEGHLLVWGETAKRAHTFARPVGKRRNSARPALLPSSASREQLEEVIQRSPYPYFVTRREFQEALGWLPTRDGTAIGSRAAPRIRALVARRCLESRMTVR